MKLARFAIIAPLALGLGLGACRQTGTPAQQEAPGKAELTVTGGQLVLPAVAGNPGAAYFTLVNGTKDPASLAAVSVAGATKAEMHETTAGSMQPLTNLTLGPGATLTFERGGKHVMLFGVAKSLKAGDSANLTLLFAGGKQVVGELKVETAGGSDHH
jgi:copper(I)-binding protein